VEEYSASMVNHVTESRSKTARYGHVRRQRQVCHLVASTLIRKRELIGDVIRRAQEGDKSLGRAGGGGVVPPVHAAELKHNLANHEDF
jgi:hypothetical protein